MRFSPSLWPTVVAIVLFGFLASLGTWQLDRAEQKRNLVTSFETKVGGERIRLQTLRNAGEALRFQPAEVTGVMDGTHQFLLDNRVHQGQAGYYVLTPLKIENSDSAVLINRGWVPLGPTRQQLPELPAPQGTVKLTGMLDIPPEKVFALGEGEDKAPGWPKVLQRIRIDLQQDQLRYGLLPVMLLLDPDQPHGFVREWKPVFIGPERHMGYAFQWFSLAAALLIIYLIVTARGAGDQDSASGGDQ